MQWWLVWVGCGPSCLRGLKACKSQGSTTTDSSTACPSQGTPLVGEPAPRSMRPMAQTRTLHSSAIASSKSAELAVLCAEVLQEDRFGISVDVSGWDRRDGNG